MVIPVQVTVWAASNPDEEPGPLEDIRRQLSDRFDFTVNVERPLDPIALKKILSGTERSSTISSMEKSNFFSLAQKNFEKYFPSDKFREILSQIYIDFGLESIRGIEAILLGAKIRGALLDKTPDIEDIIYMARFALRHRCDDKSLEEIIKHLSNIKNRENSLASSIEKECSTRKPDLSSQNIQAASEKQPAVNSKKRSVTPLERLMSMFKKGGSSAGKGRSSRSANASTSIPVAPPKKALPLKELELKDYVKTEGDLRR